MNITFFFPSFVFFTSFNILGVKNHRNQRNAGQKKPWMKQYSLAFKMSSLCVQPVTILFYSPTKVFFSSMHYESWYCTSWFLHYFLLLCKKNLLCCLYTFSPGSCKLPDPLYASSSWAQTNQLPQPLLTHDELNTLYFWPLQSVNTLLKLRDWNMNSVLQTQPHQQYVFQLYVITWHILAPCQQLDLMGPFQLGCFMIPRSCLKQVIR